MSHICHNNPMIICIVITSIHNNHGILPHQLDALWMRDGPYFHAAILGPNSNKGCEENSPSLGLQGEIQYQYSRPIIYLLNFSSVSRQRKRRLYWIFKKENISLIVSYRILEMRSWFSRSSLLGITKKNLCLHKLGLNQLIVSKVYHLLNPENENTDHVWKH